MIDISTDLSVSVDTVFARSGQALGPISFSAGYSVALAQS